MIRTAASIKLNVRPICMGFLHRCYYEGPCRFVKGEALKPEFDAKMAPQLYREFVERTKANMPEFVNLLDPIYMERTDDWELDDAIFETMAKDVNEVDLYFMSVGIGRIDLAVEFAQRHKKPLALDPSANAVLGMPPVGAALSSRGLEFYPAYSWERLHRILNALRTRKVLNNTNVLLCSRFGSIASFASQDNFISQDDVTRKLGVRFRNINLHELLDDIGYTRTISRSDFRCFSVPSASCKSL